MQRILGAKSRWIETAKTIHADPEVLNKSVVLAKVLRDIYEDAQSGGMDFQETTGLPNDITLPKIDCDQVDWCQIATALLKAL